MQFKKSRGDKRAGKADPFQAGTKQAGTKQAGPSGM
jgi:hypothetical protein